MARIFLSAVTSELGPAREIAARVLRTLGYEPVYQDEFPAGAGDLREFLQGLIDPCAAMIQLIGFRYGAEPPDVDAAYGRRSYTQYEAEYARRAGKKVYYLLLDRECAVTCLAAEDPVLAGLQAAYRREVEDGSHLYHPASTLVELELKMHQLHNELRAFRERMERRQKRTFALVGIGVVLAALVAFWVWKIQRDQQRQGGSLAGVDQKIDALQDKLLSALRQVPARVGLPPLDPTMGEAARWLGAYTQLEQELNLPPGTLERELPKLADRLLAGPDTSALDRGNALFVQKLYGDAEKAADAAIQKSIAAGGQAVQDILAGYLLAGRSAREQAGKGDAKTHWTRALEHFRAAAALTSRERDPVQWAVVQHEIAFELANLGRTSEAIPVLRAVVAEREAVRGPEHAETLSSANNLAVMLERQGDYAGAEPLYRRVLAANEKMLGPNAPDTLRSAGNLAGILYKKGDRAEAEKLFRRAYEGSQKTQGEEAAPTLICANNLAFVLENRGEQTESERLFRMVLATRERVLGPEHPDTLLSGGNLASALEHKGNLTEAEALLRRVLASSERSLGAEHPDTLQRMNNLADLLETKGDRGEAETLCRKAMEGRERVLGKDHPATLSSANNLAFLLSAKGDRAGAEQLYRRVVEASERTLGPENPDTLLWSNNLAFLLKEKGQVADAEALYRKVLAARERKLGDEHPDTILSLNNLAGLLSAKGASEEAERLYRRALDASVKTLGVEHPDACLAAFNLGAFLDSRGRSEEAKPLARQAYAGWLHRKGADDADTKDAAMLLRKLGEKVPEK